VDKAEKYLTHSSGLYGMLSWIKEQEHSGTPVILNNNTIYIHHLTARYFSLAIGREKNRKVFLAVQPNESCWIKLIDWSHFVLKENDSHLYIVSKKIEGDENEFPDIPSFSIAIPFDMIEKLDVLKDIQSLEGKEFRLENNKIYLNLKTKIIDNLKIVKISQNETHIDSSNYFDYHQVLLNKESSLLSKFAGIIPEFKGDIDEAKSIHKKFWFKLDEQFENDKKERDKKERLWADFFKERSKK
jgi:hypothetical protein